MLSLIVAMGENGVIGKDGGLPWHLPADLKHFKTMTLGKPIIMGRRTWDEIKKPLPGRRNIVVSRQADLAVAGAELVHGLEEAIALCRDEPEVMVIGGAQIYQQALPLAQRFYRTLVCAAVEGDTYFPSVDWAQWHLQNEHFQEADQRNACAMRFQCFERVNSEQ